jgi:aspartyl-tRNA(Asn)/glutamyl-tRNA(Gln) amidotransferase subunit C
MPIDRKLIEHLERLARIELSEDEREILADQLTQIVRFVEQVQAVDTGDVDRRPFAGRDDAAFVRDDVPVEGLDRDDALSGAPDVADGFFRVPPVIDRGDGG